MVKSKATCLFVLLIVVTLSGCGSSSGDSVNNANVTALEGSWVGECIEFNEGNFTGTSVWSENYEGQNYQALLTIYDTTDCSGVYVAQKQMLGEFTVGNSLMTNSGVTAYQTDLTVSQTSVDGQIANVDLSQSGFENGQSWYDIFYIDGSNLYFGDPDTGDASSVANRPTDIDFTYMFTKQ